MKFTLPSLPYNYGALEPYVDALTMEIHHTKHHQAYVDNLNKALAEQPTLQNMDLEQLLTNLPNLPESVRTAVRNNGGGHYNHTFFWDIMKQHGGGAPKGILADEIKKTFGSFEQFQEKFNATAKTVFGSGWAWLVLDAQGNLAVVPTANQDCPISQGAKPLMGLDVWEHAYYLKYQNRRPDYITAWWHVVNWDHVEDSYQTVR